MRQLGGDFDGAVTTGVAPRKLDVKALQKLLLGQKAELRMQA